MALSGDEITASAPAVWLHEKVSGSFSGSIAELASNVAFCPSSTNPEGEVTIIFGALLVGGGRGRRTRPAA